MFLFEILKSIFTKQKNQTSEIDNPHNIYLEVPYSQKEIAKNYGAKWDCKKKKWFIPQGINPNPFERWMPCEEENFRAKYFYLGQAYRNCYECNKATQVNAIILPEGFEAIDGEALDDLEELGIQPKTIPFCRQDYLSILSYLTYISSDALEEIHKYTGRAYFVKKHSKVTGYSYYRSLCQHCSAAQGDNFVISEFNSVFCPTDINDFKKIKFHTLFKSIAVRAGGNSIDYSSNNNCRTSNIY
ncbi:MAG: hypothetical protein COA94_08440 [Rickettsiales bacterium]|nr:MAG: hypothetical protein COA94_08440 [Rickettsiales bacterium]